MGAEKPESDNALERLATILRDRMEHLDPTKDWEVPWCDLTEHQREFYRMCIMEIARNPSLLASLRFPCRDCPR